MRFGTTIATLVAVLAADAAPGQSISYTEPHEIGSHVVLTQGIWDCGGMSPGRASGAMADMARNPVGQDALGAAAGCRRTLDPDRIEKPWRVVRRIASLCELRSIEKDDVPVAGGGRAQRSYVVCGREAHVLLIERSGERRVAIDVVDLSAYD